MKKRLLLLILFLVFVQDLLGQCAMCKAVAEEQADQGPTGINTGILYIMIIPYIILFVVFRKKIVGFLRELRDAKHDPIQ
ncbi:MAG: hypothetical protein R2780_05165 [Crocinitomicaceae bacterium]|nr:hypothetical protein [Crocinitomicaceae bacterium]